MPGTREWQQVAGLLSCGPWPSDIESWIRWVLAWFCNLLMPFWRSSNQIKNSNQRKNQTLLAFLPTIKPEFSLLITSLVFRLFNHSLKQVFLSSSDSQTNVHFPFFLSVNRMWVWMAIFISVPLRRLLPKLILFCFIMCWTMFRHSKTISKTN